MGGIVTVYRIFLLDDNESQLKTMQAILEDEGFDVHAFLNVNEAFDFLDSNEIDVAIFDLRMPGITEIELIERVRPIADTIPVIINTAYGSFDTAKKAVNVGAFAYLEKAGDPGNLVREVNRAIYNRLEKTKEQLELAVRERTAALEKEIDRRIVSEEALAESEKKYRLIAENSSDVIWVVDLTENRMTYVSPSVERLRGFSVQEVMNESYLDSIVENMRPAIARQIKEGLVSFKNTAQTLFVFELQQYHKDGSLVWVEMTVRVSLNPENGHIEVHGSSRDISKRKNAEAVLKVSEDRFRAISENSHNAICIVNELGKMTWVNRAMIDLSGATAEQIYAADSFAMFIAPESLEWVLMNFMKFVRNEEYEHHYEFFSVNARGEKLLIEKNMTDFIDINGQRNLAISMLDITQQRKAQRELDDSHAELKAIYESIPVAVMLIDKNRKIYKTNRVTSSIANCNENEVVEKRCGELFNCIHHLDHPMGCGSTPHCKDCAVNTTILHTLKTGEGAENIEAWVSSFEMKREHRRCFLMSTSFLKLNEQHFVLLSAQDITSRKVMEQHLQESETRYRNLFEKNSAVMLIIDPESTAIVDSNAAALKYYGYTRSQIQKLLISEINTLSKKYIRDRIQNVVSSKEQHFFFQHKLANGQIRDVEVFSGPVQQGNKTMVYSIVFDITDKKKYEEALINSDLRFRTFMNSTSDLIFIKDQKLKYIFSNKANASFMGKNSEDVVGFDDFSLMPADAARKCRATDTYSLQSYRTTTNEEIVGDRVYETTKFPVQLPDGQIGLGGIIRDITERFNSMKTIKENERKLSTLMGNLHGMAYRCLNNRAWTMLFVSEGCKELTGYNSDELIGDGVVSFLEIIHPDFRESLWNQWQEQLLKTKDFADEYMIVTKSGEQKWVFEKGSGVYDENGKIIALEGFISDITSLKEAENKLKFNARLEKTLTETLEFVARPDTSITEIAFNIAHNMSSFLDKPYIFVAFSPELIIADSEEIIHPASCGCYIGGDSSLMYPVNTLNSMYQKTTQVIQQIDESTLYSKIPNFLLVEEFGNMHPNFKNILIVPVVVNEKKMGFLMLADLSRKLNIEDQAIADRFSSIFAIALQREVIQRELKDVHNKFLQLAENINGVFVILSRNMRKLQYVNSACADLLGISIEEMYQEPFEWLNYVHTSDLILMRKLLRNLRQSELGHEASIEFRYRKNTSSHKWLQLTIFPIFNEKGEIIRFAGTLFDVTERKNLQMIEMSALIKGENSERLRFAQELHDGLGPLMSTLRMYMQAIARAEDKIQLTRFSEMSEKLFLEATRTLSEISNNISPHILTNFGLKEALRSFVEKITALHHINISMKCDCEKRFGQLIESTIYRVLCELINNSIKHGEAAEIELAMVYENGIIVIDFCDDGKGFDVNKTLKESKGMGLSNISNRIQNIQGVITFSSAPKKGFAAHIEIAADYDE